MTITVQVIITSQQRNTLLALAAPVPVSLIAANYGVANPEFEVNSIQVDGSRVLAHADVVEIFVGEVSAPTAAPVAVIVPVGGPTGAVRVLFINNDGAGFGNYVNAPAGQTIAEFLTGYDISTEGKTIRVNAQPVVASYVLLNGDKISVTPTKIEGAARVLFINNGSDGFANYVDLIDGTTITQFVSQRTGSDVPEGFTIRVNNQPVAKDQVLANGDKVVLTPSKIEGAR